MSAFVYLSSKVKIIKLSFIISILVTIGSATWFLMLDDGQPTLSSILYYILFAAIYVSALSILVLLIIRILKGLQL